MYLIAVATDYDGTLAHHGRVDEATLAALARLKASGRRSLLVTGRDLPDLHRVFDRFDLFDAVVAENGALLYLPATREERPLAPAPPVELVQALEARQIQPLTVGRGIVATWEPNETTVLECIHALGLEWQIIFNKGAVMVLPPGVNKASGLAAALDELEISPLNVLAIGDAENDHAFLQASGCSVAVANALDAVKATADLVTDADHGAGVVQVIDILLSDEARLGALAADRQRIALGPDPKATLRAEDGAVLIAGASGVGKSTLATAVIEKLSAQGFQICILDPEGDYDALQGAVVLGDAQQAPIANELHDLLRKPDRRPVTVNLLGVSVPDRPRLFADLLAQVCRLRAQLAHPHWVVVDEAHQMLPVAADKDAELPTTLPAAIYITVHPQAMRPAVLSNVRTFIGVGPGAAEALEGFCAAIGAPAPPTPSQSKDEQVLFWHRSADRAPRWIDVDQPRQERQRHTRKYAEGELGEDKSFYFRGPGDALNLRAQNLMIFLQMADGVDDATWLHHLRRGDYARWFRDAIKDEDLAVEAGRLQNCDDPAVSRKRMRDLIEARYSAATGEARAPRY